MPTCFVWAGLWLTQSDARYLCGQRRRAFSCAAASLTPALPSEKKTLCPCTSVLDSISLDFWINEKAATRHHEWQECFLLLGFAMLCNGFEIQNHDSTHQPKTEVYFRRRSALSAGWQSILQSMRLFHFQSSNSLVGILEYHSGCTHVKKFGKTFSIPCGQTFYTSVFKIGRGNFIPHPIVHRKAGNIRRL